MNYNYKKYLNTMSFIYNRIRQLGDAIDGMRIGSAYRKDSFDIKNDKKPVIYEDDYDIDEIKALLKNKKADTTYNSCHIPGCTHTPCGSYTFYDMKSHKDVTDLDDAFGFIYFVHKKVVEMCWISDLIQKDEISSFILDGRQINIGYFSVYINGELAHYMELFNIIDKKINTYRKNVYRMLHQLNFVNDIDAYGSESDTLILDYLVFKIIVNERKAYLVIYNHNREPCYVIISKLVEYIKKGNNLHMNDIEQFTVAITV